MGGRQRMQLLSRFDWHNPIEVFRSATWLHVLVILAAGAALRWPLLALAPFFTIDSRCCYYHYAVHQLLAGQPFDSGLHLPPGYSLFLAAILAVTDGSTAAAMLVQHLIGLAASLLVYLIGHRLFGPLAGLTAALLTALDVELALYEHAVMTETLFTVLLLGALALVLLRLPGSIWLKVMGFGLLAGTATLVRPTGLLLPCLVLFLPRLGPVRDATSAAASATGYRRLWHASRRVRLTLVAFVGAALIVVPMMAWNKRTHGMFTITTSLQRNMLHRIEEAPERLLRGRGSGDPLLGQIKATIHHHPTSPWAGPYAGLRERFHLLNAALDQLLVRVALDFVLAEPLTYIGDTIRRLPPILTGSHATASDSVQGSRREYIIAGGSDKLGVSAYDYTTDLAVAQAFDQWTGFLLYSRYAWPLLALAVLGGVFGPRRALVPAAVLLYVVLVSTGTGALVTRYRLPVNWTIYLLAAAGLAGLIAALGEERHSRPGWRIRLWPGVSWRTMLRRDQNPLSIAMPVTAVIVAGLMLVALAAPYRLPVTVNSDPFSVPSAQLDRLDWHLPADPPQSRLVALGLPDRFSFDLIGPDGLAPDGLADVPLLLSVRHDVWDLQTHALKFVELGDASGPTWDTTGWYQPLLVIRLEDGEYLSQHTDPRSKALKLQIGDRLLMLAAVPGQPVKPEQFGVLRLHLDSGTVLSYPVEAEPLVVSRRGTALAPQDWLAQHAAASARVAMVQREDVRVVTAGGAFSTTPWRIALTSGDRAAIRKWLHAETLERHDIQYVWVGNSHALKGEAATAVLDPTRLRPVLLEVYPDEDECPVRWRGLFVVATAAAATDVPLVPLTIPHPLADDEFRGAIRFASASVEPLAPGQTATVEIEVTNRSTQRWYGTCSTWDYPVGVAVEGRRSPAVSWTLVGEVLLSDDLPAGATAQVAVEITAPRQAGRYELRARLMQRPDRVSPATPALVSLLYRGGKW